MDLMLLRIFQRQVADQCRFALSGDNLIRAAVADIDHDGLWVGCQQLLVGAGNVSKALWGQRGRFASAREPLRESLGIRDDSALRDMPFRNHFEHYDERIDRWWANSSSHNMLDKMIGPPEMMPSFEDMDRFRVYDPSSRRIFFWGEEFSVNPIVHELDRLFPVAEAEAKKPHWESD